MRIPNHLVQPFADFLLSLELPFRQSRLRSKLVKQARAHLQELHEYKQELIEKYGDKDENGKLVTIPNDEGTVQIKVTNMDNVDSYNREYSSLMQEDWIIDESESNKDMLTTVREIILNYEGTISGEEAMQFDVYADAFENLSYKEDH
ncbi:hypothetical protein P4V41_07120 [Fictibacillus nanhaiensis]|uniref:hypothetical protein n=1 Tax=Fictibacillus nanhaiensis TaxID=742169 RepID=UPI002E218B39|nr:hypothetical protein [Fictibacillus nanhaiensis]